MNGPFARRVLTPYEAKSLVAMLHSRDPLLLERALVTVSNSAAFTANQVRYCDTISMYRDALKGGPQVV